ncbi:MAG: hypothetical protein EA425_04975 [Puniceicoccaceae bacterium]|nr:MAG: hypothetical protein EA425_04975 [Puniceicoccaceae bacterium]
MRELLNLPGQVKAIVGGMVALPLLALVFMFARDYPVLLGFLAIGLVVLGLVLVLYLLLLKWSARRQAKRMDSALSQHNTAAPSSISGPAQRARLDDLRRNFETGVQKFRSAGKDLYSLPWYAIVGEPGSGKTEAIRHSNIGFPPGLQDEFQGVGGTINMNWWFTNFGVVLDTAGRLLFEEVKPGATNEWKEFLRLLNKARPNCPINGLLLAIPADSLIKDTAEEIEKKARQIAAQLDDIQRMLDIRFPVFVILTKCDLIAGFREFFQDLTDPQLQHQMFGWANPDPLDAPFRPEAVEEHFTEVLDSVEKRRLGLLADPVPRDARGRRIEEVDALYAFPGSIRALMPRLRRYLEILFAGGEWSQKPLFLRGIYLCSSMQEGKALDQELAEALGMEVDSLPEGKAWEREKAFFLRDLFTEKVFKEQGLVTRASNTQKLLFRRRALLFGTGAVCLLLLLGLSWIGARALRGTVGEQRPYWAYAANPDNWHRGYWSPRIVSERDGAFTNNQDSEVPGFDLSLTEFHLRLDELATTRLETPAVFRPFLVLSRGVGERDRQEARRELFERGVLGPLVDAARQRFDDPDRTGWSGEATEALAVLLRIGAAAHRSPGGGRAGAPEDFRPVAGLMPFVTGGEARPELDELFARMYSVRGDAAEEWPPAWLSPHATLEEDRPIRAALDGFLSSVGETAATVREDMTTITDLRRALLRLETAEAALVELMAREFRGAEFPDRFAAARTEFIAAYDQAARLHRRSLEDALTGDDWFTLERGLSHQVERGRGQVAATIGRLQRILREESGEAVANAGAATWPAQVHARLESRRAELEDAFAPPLRETETAALTDLDQRMLSRHRTDDEPLFMVRGSVYRAAFGLADAEALPIDELSGRLGALLEESRGGMDRVRRQAADYEGPGAREFRLTVDSLLDVSGGERLGNLAAVYDQGVREQLGRLLAFPLIAPDDEQIMDREAVAAAGRLLTQVQNDLVPDTLEKIPSGQRRGLQDLAAKINRLAGIQRSLLTPAGNPAAVVVRVPGVSQQREALADFAGRTDYFAAAAETIFPIFNVTGFDRLRLRAEAEQTAARFRADQQDLVFQFFRSLDGEAPDRSVTFSGAWGPIRLLHDAAHRRSEDGKVWQLLLDIPGPGNGEPRHLLISLEFENALPARIEDWPSWETAAAR